MVRFVSSSVCGLAALVTISVAPGVAHACGGAPTQTAAADTEVTAVAVAGVNPTHCAKKAELVGSNCSYSTGMMAQRVLEQGKPYTFTGSLAASEGELKSRVAAPFRIGPENELHVIANEVVESLVATGAQEKRLTLSGRVLEVDGVQYFVATTFDT